MVNMLFQDGIGERAFKSNAARLNMQTNSTQAPDIVFAHALLDLVCTDFCRPGCSASLRQVLNADPNISNDGFLMAKWWAFERL